MRRDPEFFGDDTELSLVYIAKKLKESLQVEEVLNEAGLDYLVEPDTYSGGMIFKSQRVGAFFYVAPSGETKVREVLAKQGFEPYSLA